MGIISWQPAPQTDLIAKVATDGLPGRYDATVRLGRAELFHDGWQPMLDAIAMRTLLAGGGCPASAASPWSTSCRRWPSSTAA
jgi:hypothetical protein